MKVIQQCRAFLGSLFVFLLVSLLATGCGGGDSGSGGSSNNSSNKTVAAVTANAGLIIAVRVGDIATLDGSKSTTSLSMPLEYNWSFNSKPDTSKAVLQNANSATPSFTADVVGTYVVQLVVRAGDTVSERALGFVEASIPGDNYTGIRVHTSFPAQCDTCHDGRYANEPPPFDSVMPKSGNHPATTNQCQACHTTFGFSIIKHVDHLEVFGNCSECHNGITAIGKSEFHTKTTLECDNCHTTTSFLPLGPDGKFDHSNVTRACATCHNGTTAIGKHETHLVTDADCSFCHNTVDFKDFFVDHSAVTGDCVSCHNGTDALGQIDGHPDMAVDCGVCHSTRTFNMGGVFDHSVVDSSIQPCSGCHTGTNSINARGKIAGHIDTTSDCGNCHNADADAFKPAFVDHTGPDVVGKRCDSCHGKAGIPGMHANHMPITTQDCGECHTPGTFTTGVFNHDPAIVDPVECMSCHDGIISKGMHPNHLPTLEDCRVCHSSTETFKGGVFSHTGISDGCATCHDGTISRGVDDNHLPTSEDCSVCHTTNTFIGAVYDHAGVTSDCATCHDGFIAMDKPSNHIPARDDCSTCHVNTSTGGFAISTFFSTQHPGITRGCEGCHVSKFFPTRPTHYKSASHIPTNQDCYYCHTNTAFMPNIFAHIGIVENCESCHNGDYVTPAGAQGKSIDHPSTTQDCGVCHSITANFLDGIFDHTGIVDNCASCHGDGKPGAVTKKHDAHLPVPLINGVEEDCSVCHVPGSFATAVFSHTGIVDNCSSCHDGTAATATVKPSTHVSTADDCSACHNTTAFAGAKYDHTGIVDGCATCHDGLTARGKIPNHVPTNDDCSKCHQTTGFKPATYDHTGITSGCINCHDGTFARGKIDGHVETKEDCGVCHNTTAFRPATYNHTGIVDNCASCHGDGQPGAITKKHADHLSTTLDCHFCHTTATFVGGTWDHSGITDGCSACHDNNLAIGKSDTHFGTVKECNACHSTTGWAPIINFTHTTKEYPGDHNSSVTCLRCHTDNDEVIAKYRTSTYTGYCAACHANDYDPGEHRGTLQDNRDCGNSGCHRVSSRSW